MPIPVKYIDSYDALQRSIANTDEFLISSNSKTYNITGLDLVKYIKNHPDIEALYVSDQEFLVFKQSLSNVNNTSDASKNVLSATKLTTTRTINGTNFNGTANITTEKWGKERVLTLTGDVSGTVNIDGGSNINITTTVKGITSANVTTALGYTPMNANLKGANNGLAELDGSGKVPSTQLPSYVDDVLEYSAKSGFPATGETGKIYVDTSTNLTYRWSGTAYVEISPSVALGETSSTAYRGDRGKVAYDHSQATHARTDATKVEASTTNGKIKINGTETTVYTHPTGTNPHGTTKSDVGLSNVGNFKAVSTAANQGLTETEKANARSNIGAGAAGFSGDYNDLINKPTIPTKTSQLTNDSGFKTTDNNTTYTLTQDANNGHKITLTPSSGTATTLTIPDADTKNTAGSTDTSSKIFLIGATSQAANPQTYSQDTVYVGTDGCLYSGSKRVNISVESSSEPSGLTNGDEWLQEY